MCMCAVPAKSLQACLTLCYPIDCSLPGSCVRGILQARILQWVAKLGGSSHPGMEPTSPMSPASAGRFFTTSATWATPDMTRDVAKIKKFLKRKEKLKKRITGL